jgi:predicted house-cleaning noncanonical NTP pyrophosphatase (MazG superfamily)
MQKLVRDLIPDIITADGQIPITRVLNDDEFRAELLKKLQEEIAEYIESYQPEELADILEILHALASLDGVNPAALEMIRAEKAAKRGSFAKRIYWEGNQAQ